MLAMGVNDGKADFYPRPPRGGRPMSAAVILVGSNFYPRPPRGGRHLHAHFCELVQRFLSTPSARRATAQRWDSSVCTTNFYPRPPRGGRPLLRALQIDLVGISIHALREEGDLVVQPFGQTLEDFYPRPPRGGRPLPIRLYQTMRYFYPRPPRGGRPPYNGSMFTKSFISIHALREEGDHGPVSFSPINRLFLSTPSARRATKQFSKRSCTLPISIHALREEGDEGCVFSLAYLG